MINTYDIARDFSESLSLALGQDLRVNCPICFGVNTFVVKRYPDALVWFCYRSTCGTKGSTDTYVTAQDVQAYLVSRGIRHDQIGVKFQVPEYVIQTLPTDHDDLNKYLDKYPWVRGYTDLRWDIREERLVYVLKDDKGNLLDAHGRAVAPRKGQPKTKNYGKTMTPAVLRGATDFVVVVEDIVSAIRLNVAGISSCAILGTYLHDAHVPFLSNFSNAIICLDADAATKAYSAKRKLEQYIPTGLFMLIGSDVKDKNQDDFAALCNQLSATAGELRTTS